MVARIRIVNGLPTEAVDLIRWHARRAVIGGLSYREFMQNVERSLRVMGLWEQVALSR